MTLLQSIILGIVQGATEFIPVSSSGHMILIPWLLGWDQPGLLFNVVAHLGTAVGVLIYFRNDWWDLVKLSIEWIAKRDRPTAAPRLLILLIVGTVPVAIIGFLLESEVERLFTQPIVPAVLLLVTALLLGIGERLGEAQKEEADLTVVDSLLIGLGQTLALLPGVSRSGTTITVARLRHATRYTAARFSFLLATPIIVGAAIVQVIEAVSISPETLHIGMLAGGFFAALFTGLGVIHWLLGYLRSRSTTVFSVYCAGFSILCISLILIRGA